MEFLFEILMALLQLVGEVLLPKVGENPVPVLAAAYCLILGVLSAEVSLLVFRHSLISHQWLQIANLVIAPLIAGSILIALGRWRQRRNQPARMIYRPLYGYLFAFVFVVTRFVFTR